MKTHGLAVRAAQIVGLFFVMALAGCGGGGSGSTAVPISPVGNVSPGSAPGSVTVSWVAPKFNLDGTLTNQAALTYKVYFGTTSGGPYNATGDCGASPCTTAAGATSLTIGGLTGGVTYFFVITAVSGTAESAPSAEVSGIPL